MRILLSGAGITTNTLAYLLTRQPRALPRATRTSRAATQAREEKKEWKGHTLTILERAPSLRDTGLQVDLRGPGVEVLKRMGLDEALKGMTIREEGIRVVDAGGRRRAWFPVSRSEGSADGDGDEGREGKGRKTSLSTEWEVMRGDLCRLLFDATVAHTTSDAGAASTGGGGDGGTKHGEVNYRFGMTITDLHESEDGVDVRFSNGEREKFDLVIGGDGQNSKVREVMVRAAKRRRGQVLSEQDQGQGKGLADAQEEDSFKPLGVYAGLFTTSWPLEPSSTSPSTSNQPKSQSLIGTAYLARGKRAIFTRHHRPDRIQVYLFCRSDSPAFAALRRGHMPPNEEKALMISHFRDAGWEAERLVTALEKAEDFYCERIGFVRLRGWSSLTFPSGSSSFSSSSGQGEGSVEGSALTSTSSSTGHARDGDSDKPNYAGGRIVLVGDAAYAPSVTTGMGTTAGMVGAYVLAGEIGKHCSPPTASTTPSSPSSPTSTSEAQLQQIQTAVHEYERKLRPFITYIQKDLSEGSSAWDSLPETKLGVGLWNAMLGLCSLVRVDSFGRWVRDDKGAGWRLPDYDVD